MTPFSSSHQLEYNLFNQSALALFGKEVLCIIEPLLIKQECLSISLVDYLQINIFPDLIVVEQEEVYLKIYK